MSKKKFTLRTADGVAKEWHMGDEDIKIITPPDVIKAILINTPTDEKDFKFHAYIQNGDFIATSGGTRLRIPIGAPEHMNFRIPRATLEVVLAKVKSHKFNHDPKSDNAAHKLGFYWNEAEMTGVFETDLFTETFKVIQPELNGLEIMDLITDFHTVNKMPEYNQYAAFYDEIMERAVKTAKIVDKRGVLGLVCNGYNFAYVSFDNALTEHGMAEMLIASKQPEKDPLGLNNDKVADDTQTATQSEPHEPIEIDENIEAYILGCMNGNVSANDLEVEFDISNARAKQILKQLEDEDMVSLSHDDDEDPVYFVKMT